MSSSVPPAASQLKVKFGMVEGLPVGPNRCSPGHANIWVVLAIVGLIPASWAITKTAMMIRYGAYARAISARLSGRSGVPARPDPAPTGSS